MYGVTDWWWNRYGKYGGKQTIIKALGVEINQFGDGKSDTMQRSYAVDNI